MLTADEPIFSRGRETALILLVLAAVQFTSIVGFVVAMLLGPVLERELDLTPAWFGLIVVLHLRCRLGGAPRVGHH